MRITSLVTIAVTALAFSGPVASQQKDTQHSGMHGGQGSGAQMGHAGMQSSPGAEKAPFDLQFLDTMSAHHQMAIEMAQLAAGKAQHKEVKDLAKKIIDEQKKEIAQLSKWKKEWKLAGK
ncbi:DUF305 domain-containing protein [Noviherbaspirillum malthae]|uniref:DUF305 domain-containing protein n=1 Tax=Noviherbaspirillum malthae TaxID=1260987 RepID=UPI00188FC636|nr:DUF305 domain-containing protein [Noviherbaspirillum malthae]